MRWVAQGLNPSYELRKPCGPDRVRQFLPRLHRPVARCGTGRRGQHEHRWEILLWRLSAQRNRFRRSFKEKARGLLAGEGDCLRPISQHLFTESRNIDRGVQGLMVHSRAQFAHIGETDAEFQQARKFMRLISAWRYPDLVDRAPKAIAGMRVVMTNVGGPLSSSGAGEDQSQMILKLVRKFFQIVRPFRQSRGMPNTNSRSPCGEREGQGFRENVPTPDIAEPVIGSAFRATRWRRPVGPTGRRWLH
jgi:hypothetical protein